MAEEQAGKQNSSLNAEIEPQNINSISTTFLPKPPCCIAFSSIHDLAIIGTYELSETTTTQGTKQQARTGGIHLISINGRENSSEAITESSSLQTPFAILDLAPCPRDAFSPRIQGPHDVFAAATSHGMILLFSLEQTMFSRSFGLTQQLGLQVDETDAIVTQLVWHPTQPDVIAFTTATGTVKVLQLPSSTRETILKRESSARKPEQMEEGLEAIIIDMRAQIRTVYKHTLEAWTCAFLLQTVTPKDTSTLEPVMPNVLSGGDDAVLAQSTLPNDFAPDNGKFKTSTPWMNTRIHQAGVTAVLPVTLDFDEDVSSVPEILITGSYDDHIRVLRIPTPKNQLRQPLTIGEKNLGGGVWRVKMVKHIRPSTDGSKKHCIDLAVCCMYAGAKIVKLSGNSAEGPWQIEIVAQFTEHQSMCYGLDFSTTSLSTVFLSCSFYDKRLCLWRWPGRLL